MSTKEEYQIYTDGSCKGNPGPGGWAAILLEKNNQRPIKVLKGREKITTNNRMEMTAVIEALHYANLNAMQSKNLTLYCDSNLIVQTLLKGWKRKANLDLWEELDGFNEQLEVKFVWIKGHHKNYWNNECDKIAQKEARLAMLHG